MKLKGYEILILYFQIRNFHLICEAENFLMGYRSKKLLPFLLEKLIFYQGLNL